MIRISRILAAAIVAVPLVAGGALAQDSLYKRLGGYDAIAAVTDDFLATLITDEKFSRFFAGASNDSKKRIRQHVIDLVCQSTGGPCVYTGRDMKTSHEGLGISKAEWDASVAAFVATLGKLKVPEAEQKELAAIILPLEKDIVEKP
jgi:hemoglobin